HVVMALTFWHTIWPRKKRRIARQLMGTFLPSVDIFIPVAGEPIDVIKQTASAAKQIHYPNKKIYILNDGYVAKKDNWQDVENLAKELGVFCITRKYLGG